MKYILLVIIALLGIFYYFKLKYYNPHKFFFIFGLKGSGKSCYMVHEMLKYLKKGWTIYTDMDVYIPGIRIISNADDLFRTYTPVEHSVIFLDECGATWSNRDWKKFDSKINDWFRFQRKYKCRVYANSQSFDIDKALREKTDSMILQTNIGNIISVSRPIIRKISITNPEFTGESKIVDALQFASPFSYRFYFMPRYFKYFNSFEVEKRPYMPYKLSGDMPTYKQLRKLGFSKKVCTTIISAYEKHDIEQSQDSLTFEASCASKLGEPKCNMTGKQPTAQQNRLLDSHIVYYN